jgi:hypothetical protein
MMKFKNETVAGLWIGVMIFSLCAAILLLQGCDGDAVLARKKANSNSAATIYEAAAAIEMGVPTAKPVEAIKNNASAIADLSEHPYPPVEGNPVHAVPAATSQDWIDDENKSLVESNKQADHTKKQEPEPTSWGEIAGGTAVVLGTIATVVKCLSPGNPLVGMLGGLLDTARLAILPKGVKRKEEKDEVFAIGGKEMIRVIETMDNGDTVKHLKNKFSSKLPSAVLDAIKLELANLNSNKFPPGKPAKVEEDHA